MRHNIKNTYTENYFGIEYNCKRDEDLVITANVKLAKICISEGLLHIFNRDSNGRTALFLNDVKSLVESKGCYKVVIRIGSPTYIKELAKWNRANPVHRDYAKQLDLGKLW